MAAGEECGRRLATLNAYLATLIAELEGVNRGAATLIAAAPETLMEEGTTLMAEAVSVRVKAATLVAEAKKLNAGAVGAAAAAVNAAANTALGALAATVSAAKLGAEAVDAMDTTLDEKVDAMEPRVLMESRALMEAMRTQLPPVPARALLPPFLAHVARAAQLIGCKFAELWAAGAEETRRWHALWLLEMRRFAENRMGPPTAGNQGVRDFVVSQLDAMGAGLGDTLRGGAELLSWDISGDVLLMCTEEALEHEHDPGYWECGAHCAEFVQRVRAVCLGHCKEHSGRVASHVREGVQAVVAGTRARVDASPLGSDFFEMDPVGCLDDELPQQALEGILTQYRANVGVQFEVAAAATGVMFAEWTSQPAAPPGGAAERAEEAGEEAGEGAGEGAPAGGAAPKLTHQEKIAAADAVRAGGQARWETMLASMSAQFGDGTTDTNPEQETCFVGGEAVWGAEHFAARQAAQAALGSYACRARPERGLGRIQALLEQQKTSLDRQSPVVIRTLRLSRFAKVQWAQAAAFGDRRPPSVCCKEFLSVMRRTVLVFNTAMGGTRDMVVRSGFEEEASAGLRAFAADALKTPCREDCASWMLVYSNCCSEQGWLSKIGRGGVAEQLRKVFSFTRPRASLLFGGKRRVVCPGEGSAYTQFEMITAKHRTRGFVRRDAGPILDIVACFALQHVLAEAAELRRQVE